MVVAEVMKDSRRQPEREQRIRERAHALWEGEGRPEGRSEAHWARACREIAMEEQPAETRSAGSDETDAPEEAGAKNYSRLQAGRRTHTWALIGVVALLLVANVVRRRAAWSD